MLVLSRKVGEEIVIGNNIHLMVVAIKGDKVRIGISAPKEVVVDRLEVHEKRQNLLNEWTGPESYKTIA
jgi:carbon storage regulator